ncbi:class II aldolase [bacterium]|nr:MAG: class II aldolase [bacterium]
MTPREEAAALARVLGDPAHDLAMLAEGNTSAREDAESFWVKASGLSMREIGPEGFVRVAFGPVLEAQGLDDASVRALLASSRLESGPLMPSVETFMHAWLLTLPGVTVVGHCHPTDLLPILCRPDAEERAKERFFPDEIVCCGPASAWVPYVDPGLPLAAAVREGVEAFVREWGSVPKTIWMGNHGLIALGANRREVEAATLMSAKAARVRLGGATQPLSREQVERIATRPDEHYRQRLLWQLAQA